MQMIRVLLLLFSLPICSASARRQMTIDHTFKFYKDQVGVNDWHQNYVGKVTSMAFRPRNHQVAYVVTESSVIASLKMSTGKIKWRRVLPEGEKIDFIITSQEYLLTLSEDGSIARLWLSTDGSLIWDTNTYSTPKGDQHITNVLRDRSRTPLQHQNLRDYDALFLNPDWSADFFVAILCNNQVIMRKEQQGLANWEWNADPTRNLQCLRLILGNGKDDKFVLHVVCAQIQDLEQAIVIVSLDPWTGKIVSETSEELPPTFSPNPSNLVILSSGIVLVLKKEEASLIIIDLTTLVVKIVPHYLTGSPYTRIADIGMKSIFVMETQTERTMFEISPIPDLAMSLISTFPIRKNKHSIFHSPLPNSFATHIGYITQEKSSLSIELMAAGSYDNRKSFKVPFSGHGEIESVYIRGKDPYIFVVSADDSLTIIRDTKIISTCEEALGSVQSVKFVDIHTSEDQLHFAKQTKESTHLVVEVLQDVSNAFINIPVYLVSKYGTPEMKKLMRITGAERKTDDILEKDEFGFRKIILLTTACGKLFGLNSLTGDIVWKHYLQQQDNFVGKKQTVFLIRPDRALYIDITSPSPSLHYFNPTVGKFEDPIKLKYKILQANLLQIRDSEGTQLLMLVDTEMKVHILPNSESAKKAFLAKIKDIYFYMVDIKESAVQGFHVTLSQNDFLATNIWTIAFPKDVERISSFAAPSDDVVNSPVRTLGPTEYLTKYLNPNLLAIATVRSTKANLYPLPNRKIKDIHDPSIIIYLVDVVAGSILDKRVHRHGKGPVTLHQSENLVVYHFWNAQDHRFEVSVLELYESEGERKPSLLKKKQDDFFSSKTAQQPDVIQQAYVFSTAIKSLTSTKTRRGITARHFLAGLNSDQVMGISRNVLDPRRMVIKDGKAPTMTQFSSMPYSPIIPMDPLQIISYNITINNLRGVETSHAILESTSLVFAYGVDLFFTRITPSQRFDLLSDDFNYVFLVLSVSAVFMAIAVTKRLERRKSLKSAWK